MNAIANTDLDYSMLRDLRKRLPELSEVDLAAPRMEDVGKRAGQTVDRLLGRERRTPWAQVAAIVGVAAVLAVAMAWLTWSRRSPWSGQSSGVPSADLPAGTTDPRGEPLPGEEVRRDLDHRAGGLTAAEASLTVGEADERA